MPTHIHAPALPHPRVRRMLRATTATLATVALGATLTACGADGGSASGAGERLKVVASTNVYGDIAKQVGGDAVQVTSILTSPDQDPHSFEANPRTALAISKADLLIENGGGYDDYMGRLRTSSSSDAPVIDVVDLSGKKAPAGGELNEHVWYDLPTVQKLATAIAADLGKADRDRAGDFRSRARTFNDKVDALVAREKTLAARTKGQGIGITEPVPLYMTQALGLVNKTPEAFSEAVEEGDDVAASVLRATLALYRQKQVVALVYNEQTAGPVTEKVKAAATQAGVAVVPVTETMPRGDSYLSWMRDNLDAIASAAAR